MRNYTGGVDFRPSLYNGALLRPEIPFRYCGFTGVTPERSIFAKYGLPREVDGRIGCLETRYLPRPRFASYPGESYIALVIGFGDMGPAPLPGKVNNPDVLGPNPSIPS